MTTYQELFQSIIDQNITTIEKAIPNNFDINTPDEYGFLLLHRACANHAIEIVKFLIKNHSKINELATDNWSPLHLSSVSGCLGCISLLSRAGANMNATDIYGNTALHLSVICRNPQVSQVLIEYGCNKNFKNKKGLIPFDIAKKEGQSEFYNILKI